MGHNNQLAAVEYEVPQGSVLGPLVNNICAGDLSIQKLKGRHYPYANDTVILYRVHHQLQLQNQINHD